MKSGGLGIVIDTTSPGTPTQPAGGDEPEVPSGTSHVFISAPNAGSTPYPLPLTFQPPIEITENHSNGVRAQRASDGLPAAAVDPRSGAVYAVFDGGRFRTPKASDAVIRPSSDNGPKRQARKNVQPGEMAHDTDSD